MKSLVKLIILIAVGLTFGCTAETPDDLTADCPLTIEGWIDSDGYPSVLVTWAIRPDKEGGSLDEAIVRWAKVTIDDGEREVTLTGGIDKNYVPPYRYFTFDMKGEPGKTYRLTAEFAGRRVTAVSTMPHPVEIEEIRLGKADIDTLRTATIRFTAPTGEGTTYYHLSTGVDTDKRLYPAMLGTVCAAPGETVEMAVYRGKHFGDTLDFTPNWPVGRKMTINLERIDKAAFDFWRAYDDMVMFSGAIFVSASLSLPSNIEGGLGVWSARGVCRRRIEIE